MCKFRLLLQSVELQATSRLFFGFPFWFLPKRNYHFCCCCCCCTVCCWHFAQPCRIDRFIIDAKLFQVKTIRVPTATHISIIVAAAPAVIRPGVHLPIRAKELYGVIFSTHRGKPIRAGTKGVGGGEEGGGVAATHYCGSTLLKGPTT